MADATPPPPPKSGIRAALEYTGIPASWLSKRPKLPSRNTLIFLSVTSSIAGYYIYDRRESKRIKAEYIEKVKHLSEEPSPDYFAMPRKVSVLGCRWPGDEDVEQGVKYFKKYVKPILVAAAVDYDIINGKRHGDLADHVAEEIKRRRRVDAGLEAPLHYDGLPPNHPLNSPEIARQRGLEGGIVVLGRPAWKEFMCGLKRGWTESLQKVDTEELLSHELSNDGVFDEEYLDPAAELEREVATPGTAITPLPTPSVLAALRNPPKEAKLKSRIPPELDQPPTNIPALPPILFVSFIDYIGFKQIPIMLWDWFNQREKVRSGAEAAYKLVMNQTRPIDPPKPATLDGQGGDLDFDLWVEEYYRKYLDDMPEEIEKERKGYYEKLSERLKTARELSRGEREPTKQEVEKPPKTEVELREERMKKEKRWRSDAVGWEVVKRGKLVEWDERFRDMHVFVGP